MGLKRLAVCIYFLWLWNLTTDSGLKTNRYVHSGNATGQTLKSKRQHAWLLLETLGRICSLLSLQDTALNLRFSWLVNAALQSFLLHTASPSEAVCVFSTSEGCLSTNSGPAWSEMICSVGCLLYLSSSLETGLLLNLELCWQPVSPSNLSVSFHPQQHWDWKHAHSHIWFQKRVLSMGSENNLSYAVFPGPQDLFPNKVVLTIPGAQAFQRVNSNPL